MRVLVCLIFALYFSCGAELKIATYNVENLFDGITQGSEYNDFRGNWGNANYLKKLASVAKVIKGLDADFISLNEIENEGVLRDLANACGYEYYVFASTKNAPVGLGVMSRKKIISSQKIEIEGVKTRPILRTQIEFAGEKLNFFSAHFPAIKNSAQDRTKAANTMIKVVRGETNAVILGDLNSEFGRKFLLNELSGEFKNLWIFVNSFTRKSRVKGGAIDHIMLSADFFDGEKIEFKQSSFGVFKPFLADKVSDHYPIYAILSDEKGANSLVNSDKKENSNVNSQNKFDEQEFKQISEIYGENLPAKVRAYVVFSDAYGYVLADESKRGIYVFSKDKFKLGSQIEAIIYETKNYKANLEVDKIDILSVSDSAHDVCEFALKNYAEARSGDLICDVNLLVERGFSEFNGERYKIYSPQIKIKDGRIRVKRAFVWNFEGKKELIVEMEKR